MLKKGLSLLFVSLLSWCVIEGCIHVHTDECSEKCTHDCYGIAPCIDEPAKL